MAAKPWEVEKQEQRQQVTDETIRPGTCSVCGVMVMYARPLGLLTVVDALPYEGQEWQAIADGRATYSVFNGRLKMRFMSNRVGFDYLSLTVHAEHLSCGKMAPVPLKVPKDAVVDDGWPPFDPRVCCRCRTFFTDDERASRAYVGYYISSSLWWAAHDTTCEDVSQRATVKAEARKPRYDKVDKFCRRIEGK